MGSVMDIPLGAGKGLIQANKGAREWEAGGSWLLYSGRAGRPGCLQSWVEFRAWGQDSAGNPRRSVRQSSRSLSSSLPSSLPRKIPARKLGVYRGLSLRGGCGSLPATPLPPRFPPPCKGQLVRPSSFPGQGDRCRGPTEGAPGQSRAPAAQEGKQREAEGP